MYHLKKITLQQWNNTPGIMLHLDFRIKRTNITGVVNFPLKVVAGTACNWVILNRAMSALRM